MSDRSIEESGPKLKVSMQQMHHYYADLFRTPLLGVQRERELFRKLASFRTQLDQLPSRDESERKRRLEGQYIRLRNQIVQANLRLVASIARKMAPLDEFSRFDLISEGNETLIRSVELFDVERGVKFSTYATTAISRQFWKLLKSEKLHGERFVSGSSTVDYEPSSDNDVAFSAEHTEPDQLIRWLFTRLKPRERFILEGRFGMGNHSGELTYRELAAQLKLSKERVRQIEKAAVANLRKHCDKHRIDCPLSLA